MGEGGSRLRLARESPEARADAAFLLLDAYRLFLFLSIPQLSTGKRRMTVFALPARDTSTEGLAASTSPCKLLTSAPSTVSAATRASSTIGSGLMC